MTYINHYGHTIDVTTSPAFCSDCDVEFYVDEQVDESEVEISRREWLLGGYTDKELIEELQRRNSSVLAGMVSAVNSWAESLNR